MKTKVFRFIYYSLLLIFLAVLISNMVFFIKSEMLKKRDDEIYESIKSKIVQEDSSIASSDKNSSFYDDSSNSYSCNSNTTDSKYYNTNSYPYILPEYEEVYSENSDFYGWIKIDDTLIDFPVMYSPNNPEFYSRKNFAKEYSEAGTPFILEPSTDNTIIFGHNMSDSRVFSTLKKYKDINYWKEHKYIKFNTLYERSLYEIFLVTNAKVYYNPEEISDSTYMFYTHTSFNTEQDFNNYVSNLRLQQYFDSGISAKYGDSLITLCTCDYVYSDARLLIIAKKCNN